MLLTTDTALARRALGGDGEAFRRIFEASLPCVWGFATRHSRGRAAAERLTQRVLERVFLDLGRYDGEVPFAAWLLSLCKEVATRDRGPLGFARARRSLPVDISAGDGKRRR
jgi:DNA-directed RNA polymerase specialized sigma24 family protein